MLGGTGPSADFEMATNIDGDGKSAGAAVVCNFAPLNIKTIRPKNMHTKCSTWPRAIGQGQKSLNNNVAKNCATKLLCDSPPAEICQTLDQNERYRRGFPTLGHPLPPAFEKGFLNTCGTRVRHPTSLDTFANREHIRPRS